MVWSEKGYLGHFEAAGKPCRLIELYGRPNFAYSRPCTDLQYGPKYFGILGILSFFKNESMDENLDFALSSAFNGIFQFGRG